MHAQIRTHAHRDTGCTAAPQRWAAHPSLTGTSSEAHKLISFIKSLPSVIMLAAVLLAPAMAMALVPTTVGNRYSPAHAIRPRRVEAPITARLLDVNKLWAEYVLLRPTADECEIKDAFEGTTFELSKAPQHGFGADCQTARTPGTLRTAVFSTFLCLLIAVPVLVSNPLVVQKLLEVRAIRRLESRRTPWHSLYH